VRKDHEASTYVSIHSKPPEVCVLTPPRPHLWAGRGEEREGEDPAIARVQEPRAPCEDLAGHSRQVAGLKLSVARVREHEECGAPRSGFNEEKALGCTFAVSVLIAIGSARGHLCVSVHEAFASRLGRCTRNPTCL
jgi:hypothetical protein